MKFLLTRPAYTYRGMNPSECEYIDASPNKPAIFEPQDPDFIPSVTWLPLDKQAQAALRLRGVERVIFPLPAASPPDTAVGPSDPRGDTMSAIAQAEIKRPFGQEPEPGTDTTGTMLEAQEKARGKRPVGT